MRKKIILFGVWVIWTLICIYGTYYNTINSVEVAAIEEGYEILYCNTGDIYTYLK